MELLQVQQIAADQLADRTVAYVEAPLQIGRKERQRRVPFVQILKSITASGKTLILADAVSTIAKRIPVKPVVLWLSKASVVVAQSYANLDAGGAYHNLLDDFVVSTLADYDEDELNSSRSSFLFFATVGTFTQDKKEHGTLNVFKSAIDDANGSTWNSLKLRPDQDRFRRPLVIVYDEAHNLTDRQTNLLLELDPDVFLLATATNRLPERINTEVIEHLRRAGDLTDQDLETIVDAAEIAKTGLIKKELNLIGRRAPMEDVVSEMLQELDTCTRAAGKERLLDAPKAVYVCKTNMTSDSGERDDPKKPFLRREAPPILIWRHLTERLKVPPETIAVYCDLKTDKAAPLPRDFILFRGGDKDYDTFVNGNFRHIIFNQSLQEGWDEPFVYFAYIDKSVGSRVQAEQIIGRLLRQPGRKHYPDDRLNAATIFVRVEASGVFEEVVRSVEQRIRTGELGIKLSPRRIGTPTKEDVPVRKRATVPVTALVTDRAEARIADVLKKMTDYRPDDGRNVRGVGRRAVVQRIVGAKGTEEFKWEEYGQSPMVLARWLFSREVCRVHKGALGVAITSGSDGEATKFEALVGLDSIAAQHIADVAHKVAQTFVDQVYLKLRGVNPFEVGPTQITPGNEQPFHNAIHRAYDRVDHFNNFERGFADTIDARGLLWCRNPSRSGYGIPLPTPGKSLTFYPDFLVWKANDVFAIDTKGAFLHADAARKLVSIRPSEKSPTRVFVRFISEGVVDTSGPQPDSTGFTVWTFKPNGEPDFIYTEDLSGAVEACLVPDI